MKRNSQSGVALVITLIMLSVITFMAVTFLVVSRHGGAQVDTLTQQANAKLAAESGSAQAMSQIGALMLANTNGLTGGLLVSTNFTTNSYGGTANITDVSYYDQNGNLLTGSSMQSMLNNLLILPRPPVFVVSNRNQTTPADFRFFLDLNRNGKYDTNGSVLEVDVNNQPIKDSKGNLTYSIRTGDPEWVGVLNHPEARHSSSNFFVSRYCFIALPIGNSLDINYIHNQSLQLSDPMNLGQDGGYLRNQGVGSWELNMAAFLNALNKNYWSSYAYNPFNGFANQGMAFNDAASIVQYRFNKSFRNVAAFPSIYTNSSSTNFTHDFIDGYCVGPLMTSVSPLAYEMDYQVAYIRNPPFSWSGADNPNPFFTTQDLFGAIPSSTVNPLLSFTNNLYSAGRGSATSDRYTFYTMLSQMSFGSAAESASYPYAASANPNFASAYPNTSKLNLNYVNVGGVSATNFVPWTPAQFFTNAADRMLRAYFPTAIRTNIINGQQVFSYISITNIPIYPTNYYTPAVHRVLQLAANIYDSVNTNRVDPSAPNGPYFPSVFRPYFSYQYIPGKLTNIFINGYEEVVDTNTPGVFVAPKDFRRTQPPDLNKFLQQSPYLPIRANVYGVPYVIGARQGFPSFNKFSSIPVVQMWRAMELIKPYPGALYGSGNWQYNVRYSISVSNYMAIECWNPSTNAYQRPTLIYAFDDYSTMLTNNVVGLLPKGLSPGLPALLYPALQTNFWPGATQAGSGVINSNSFIITLATNVVAVTNSYLQLSPSPQLVPTSQAGSSVSFETTKNYFVPQFGYNVTNRVWLVMVDQKTGRIIDYVMLGGLGGLAGPDTVNNINSDLQGLDGSLASANQFWTMNASNSAGVPSGFNKQVVTGATATSAIPNVWAVLNGALTSQNNITTAAPLFNNWLYSTNPTNTSTTYQVPLVAYRTYATLNNTWAANDPLVHYMASDLTSLASPPTNYPYTGGNPLVNISGIPFGTVTSARYQPWGVGNNNANLRNLYTNAFPYALPYKDPMVVSADSWQFPTNKFPNVGWLGRVHRGTPWQTVYLKANPVAPNDWQYWTGDSLANYYGINDPLISQPTSDWLLMDLFTTSPNDNASKGQLSINQPNQAAWAAVLDGVIVVNNSNSVNLAPWVIDPVINYNALLQIVAGINAQRTALPGQAFTSLGQILSVPQLTVNSPFFNTAINTNLLSDAVYERIPQQIMSLLRLGTPRYVIFAYGQSLKPAEHSIVQSGPFFGMCTNYQITGEVATRSVVRFDNFPVPGQKVATQPRAVVESFNVLGPE